MLKIKLPKKKIVLNKKLIKVSPKAKVPYNKRNKTA